jgi:hypothetical protein
MLGVGPKAMLPRNIKTVFRYLPWLLALRFGRQFSVEGIRMVVPFRDCGRADMLRAKAAAALRLIQNHRPKYYERIRRFIPNLLIVGSSYSYAATTIFDLHLCELSEDYALSDQTTAEQLAMTLVHEATHGYLQFRGTSYKEERRARIERVCVQTEIAFANGLPQADALVSEARRRLEYEPGYWTNESFLQRNLRALTKAGAPRWLVRSAERIGVWRLRAGAGKALAQP